MPYDFDKQKEHGQIGETVIGSWLSQEYILTPATLALQLSGVDWVGVHRATGATVTFEVKTDGKAHVTGNAFVETVSVDRADGTQIPGWGKTCGADYLLYYMPASGLVYFLRPATIRQILPHWQEVFPAKACQNLGYRTHGVLVPLPELATLAIRICRL